MSVDLRASSSSGPARTTRARVPILAIVVGLGLVAGATLASKGELIGVHPRPWTVDHWINSPPLELTELEGKVVLVRWWTGPHCPLCRASAAALNEFHERFAGDGLVVIGLYHHKSASALYAERVERYARTLGFEFPVAIDRDWATLRSWWLDGFDRSYTSVTFLLGRDGAIRYVHPGGRYVRGDGQFERLETEVERLLAEPSPVR